MKTKASRDYLLLVSYCGLIFYLSHQPVLPTTMLFEHQDKLVHAMAYAVMASLAWSSFRHYLHSYKYLFLAAVMFSSLYGLSDELHQSYIVGRHADVLDWAADTVGACLAATVIWLKLGFKEREEGHYDCRH